MCLATGGKLFSNCSDHSHIYVLGAAIIRILFHPHNQFDGKLFCFSEKEKNLAGFSKFFTFDVRSLLRSRGVTGIKKNDDVLAHFHLSVLSAISRDPSTLFEKFT